MFDDNKSNDNQDQSAQDNNSSAGQVNAPANPADSGISSFTMDPPHPAGPDLPPTQAATIEPPAPPPPLPDVDSADAQAVSIPAPEPPSSPLSDEPKSTDNDEHSTVDDNSVSEPSDNKPSPDDAGLLEIKQQALTQLSPMLGHLDQTPEEKFRTTMMMIQANDDKSLIKDAYAAAQQITDEKTKAQALLDVVNEINYFTHS